MIHDLTDVKLWSIQLFNWSDEIISHRHFHWIALRECSPHQVTYSTIIKGINILLCIKQLKCWESWNKAVPWGRKEGSSLSVVGSPRRRLHCCPSAFTFYYFWQSYKLGKKPAPSRRFSSFFLQPKKKKKLFLKWETKQSRAKSFLSVQIVGSAAHCNQVHRSEMSSAQGIACFLQFISSSFLSFSFCVCKSLSRVSRLEYFYRLDHHLLARKHTHTHQGLRNKRIQLTAAGEGGGRALQLFFNWFISLLRVVCYWQ